MSFRSLIHTESHLYCFFVFFLVGGGGGGGGVTLPGLLACHQSLQYLNTIHTNQTNASVLWPSVQWFQPCNVLPVLD